MNRQACASCGVVELDVFLDLGETPIANTYPDQPDAKEDWYPLQLATCRGCGLVQLMAVIDDDKLYGADYGFYSGGSVAQQNYHAAGAALLLERYGEEARRLTVEVACNDGSLLTHFAQAGARCLGIDPAQGPAELARTRGLDVVNEPLTLELAESIRSDFGPAGLVIAYNCMAHVGDLADVLAAVACLMDEDSVAVIEVQYLPDLLAGNMYDQVYHEHRYFYSLTTLRAACELRGLYVTDAELIELQGGGLRVSLSTRRPAHPSVIVEGICQSEWWLPKAYPGFQGKVERTRDHLRSLVLAAREQGTVAGYGAAAKATTIVNFAGLASHLEYVVDTTPYKQGRYLPGTGLQILSPEDAAMQPADTLLLLAANYLGHVLRHNPHRGRWIVPQPLPALI